MNPIERSQILAANAPNVAALYQIIFVGTLGIILFWSLIRWYQKWAGNQAAIRYGMAHGVREAEKRRLARMLMK